ncbi:MAG: CopD family protein [Pigmentiphaga sp.]
MIAALKFLHIVGLAFWCAALIALPLLLHLYGGARRERQFIEFRLLTHIGYIALATPAALLAISAGTALIFLERVFEPWLFVKLAFVAAMALIHMWFGHLIQRSGEERKSNWMPGPVVGLLLVAPLIATVLWLVLAKPAPQMFETLIPHFLLVPQDRGL